MKSFFITIFLLSVLACKNKDSKPSEKQLNIETTKEDSIKKPQRPLAYKNRKFFEENGRKMLYGGKDSLQNFDISNTELNNKQFHYGIGREAFPALLKPKFTTIKSADSLWNDDDRFILAYSGNDVKAYSVKDLTHHEVVNDVLNGEPIMAVYCVLADLGAIYDRQYGDKELTFALSGYTYYDQNVWNGLDGFVLWDRETESLWWPLIDRAVSGKLKGVELLEKDKSHWKDTNWKYIKDNYPNAKILISGQDYKRPKTWQKFDDVSNIVKNYSANKE